MTKNTIQRARKLAQAALDELRVAHEALAQTPRTDPHYPLFADSVIKRFEIAFEYCWKTLKAAVEHAGGEAAGPRPAIQEAVRLGWIDDAELWADALDARNGSVHDYFGISQEEYLQLSIRFVAGAAATLARLVP